MTKQQKSMTREEMGGGNTCPTLTGDHQNRITDYTAIVIVRTPHPVSENTKKE